MKYISRNIDKTLEDWKESTLVPFHDVRHIFGFEASAREDAISAAVL